MGLSRCYAIAKRLFGWLGSGSPMKLSLKAFLSGTFLTVADWILTEAFPALRFREPFAVIHKYLFMALIRMGDEPSCAQLTIRPSRKIFVAFILHHRIAAGDNDIQSTSVRSGPTKQLYRQ